MTDIKMLIGSLSNDLYRVASLTGRGSQKAADRFWRESKRWTAELSRQPLKGYIKNIILDIDSDNDLSVSKEKAEKLLMYGVLLQNHSLHLK